MENHKFLNQDNILNETVLRVLSSSYLIFDRRNNDNLLGREKS